MRFCRKSRKITVSLMQTIQKLVTYQNVWDGLTQKHHSFTLTFIKINVFLMRLQVLRGSGFVIPMPSKSFAELCLFPTPKVLSSLLHFKIRTQIHSPWIFMKSTSPLCILFSIDLESCRRCEFFFSWNQLGAQTSTWLLLINLAI